MSLGSDVKKMLLRGRLSKSHLEKADAPEISSIGIFLQSLSH